jgi:aspartyl-tRNA(Asn)/glutamyl-tRNA(Gln) amidotransferase subunit A
MGLGTDTGGSTRIRPHSAESSDSSPPSAASRAKGVLPLSRTLDSVGPLANSVECCRITDALLSDEPIAQHPPVDLRGLRFLVPDNYVLDQMDATVARDYEAALAALAAAGAKLDLRPLPALSRVPEAYARGTIAGVEAYAWHRRAGTLAQRDRFDPNVLARIEHGGKMLAADFLDLLAARDAIIADANRTTQGYDAVLMPTTPIVAPRLADVADAAGFAAANALLLRNPHDHQLPGPLRDQLGDAPARRVADRADAGRRVRRRRASVRGGAGRGRVAGHVARLSVSRRRGTPPGSPGHFSPRPYPRPRG